MADDRQTIHDRILKALKEELKGRFKTFYDGDPVAIPPVNLPAIVVATEEDTTDTERAPTGHDRVGEEITIKVVLNKKDDIGRSQDVDSNHRKLRQWVGARDPETGEYKPNTVKGVLRKNLTLAAQSGQYQRPVISNRMRVRYRLATRPNELISDEAHVTVSTAENVPVSGRT